MSKILLVASTTGDKINISVVACFDTMFDLDADTKPAKAALANKLTDEPQLVILSRERAGFSVTSISEFHGIIPYSTWVNISTDDRPSGAIKHAKTDDGKTSIYKGNYMLAQSLTNPAQLASKIGNAGIFLMLYQFIEHKK